MGNYTTKTPDHDQKVLTHLLSFLGRKNDSSVSDVQKLKIKSCLTEMLEINIDIWKVAKELEPYKEDVIPILVEAMNPDLDHAFISSNAGTALEIIGDYRAIPPILDNFDKLFEYGSLTPLLKKIAAREGTETTSLIAERLVLYIAAERKIHPYWKSNHDRNVRNIIDTLMELNALTDPRLSSVLEEKVSASSYDSYTFQIALLALSKIDLEKAILCLNNKMNAIEADFIKSSQKYIRIVSEHNIDNHDQAIFTVCIKDYDGAVYDEVPYAFKYEKPLVYFLVDGMKARESRRLAGRSEQKSDIVDIALIYLGKFLPEIKLPETKYQECNKLLRENLDFERWGFTQSYILPKVFPVIIYDSKYFRIKFSFEGGDHPGDETIHLQVYYGRLHAPSDDSFMIWNGKKCWCWHRIDYALNFFDRLSPEEAIKVEYRPRIIEQYRNSDATKQLSAAQRTVGLVAEIWKSYGQKLSQLFDLEHTELWEQFADFMKEFHAIKKSNSHGYPAYDKIC